MQVKKQQLEPDMEQWTGSKLGKEYAKAVYRHLAYLTYTDDQSKPGSLIATGGQDRLVSGHTEAHWAPARSDCSRGGRFR